MVSDYEKQRAINIGKNKELLQSLGLDQPLFEPKETPRKIQNSRKRKIAPDVNEEVVSANKTPRILSTEMATSVRRSSRSAGKKVDYTSEQQGSERLPLVQTRTIENTGPLRGESNTRVYDPKTFGPIPGIEVGTWWESRQACSNDSIHAPWVAGISGGAEGAYSVALSGGYDDDVDLGYAFTYTGSGGRDLKGTKTAPKNLRTAPQSSDQRFDNNFNKALKRSLETKNPIRVIRGYKLKSAYAPSEGYRYDGLYTVEKAWMERGLNPKGYLVCKYAFKRLSGQPPLPMNQVKSGSEATDDVASTV